MNADQAVVPLYSSLPKFVTWLSTHYARQVTDTTEAVWCPWWWKHPEVRARLENLWHLLELRRLDGPEGVNSWWFDADMHMRGLLDPRGPMKYCSARHGHRDLLAPLPLAEPPAGMFESLPPLAPAPAAEPVAAG